MTTEQEITKWVAESLTNEDINNMNVSVSGHSERGDNYAGEITFVSATGSTECGRNTEIPLVIKTGKRTGQMKEEMDMKLLYIREVYIYSTIFPKFLEFQLSKRSKNIFWAVPKCYKTLLEEDVEILVLENLKRRGYELHNRQVTMNVNHLMLVLKNYAKFHAISFVMRDQQPETFNELTADMKPLMKTVFLNQKLIDFYNNTYTANLKLIEEDNPELSGKLYSLVGKGIAEALFEVEDAKVDDVVITHGDCWNNNFLFKYEENNYECPKDVKILDWQLSSSHSPVIDLSYFIYIVSSKQELDKFDEILQFYYTNLCFFIREMGSDPEKLFPYSKLLSHWNQFSVYGLTFVITSLQMMMCDKNDAPSMDDSFDDVINSIDAIKSKNTNEFKTRLLAAVEHFCTWNRSK